MKLRRSGNFRAYATVAARKIAVRRLIQSGYNYFVGYREAGEPGFPAGLGFGKVDWLAPGEIHVKDVNRLVH